MDPSKINKTVIVQNESVNDGIVRKRSEYDHKFYFDCGTHNMEPGKITKRVFVQY